MALVPNKPKSSPGKKYQDESAAMYDELVGMDRGFEQAAANEPASPEEQEQYDNFLSMYIKVLDGPQQERIVDMLDASKNLYQGVSRAAFLTLQSTKLKYEQTRGAINPSVFFGEGGMISTAVDLVFQMAQAAGIAQSDDMEQYSAAQFDIMRQVGEHMRAAQEDGAIGEAQDYLVDMEMGPDDSDEYDDVDPPDAEDRRALESAAAPPMEEPAPEPEMPMPEEAPMPPQSGGLV